MLRRIISGGQTGVDRAALDAALELQFTAGGWCPAGRRAEDGEIPARYPLVELPQGGYRRRTLKNVVEADATVIIHFGEMQGGTAATRRFCIEAVRPCLLIDGDRVEPERAVDLLAAFILDRGVAVLNVAGPRASTNPGAYGYARAVIEGVIRRFRR